MCVSNLFGGGQSSPTPVPEVVAPPPVVDNTKDTVESKAAREKQKKAAALAKGRESTILTSPLGVEGVPAEQNKSTLLGM